MATKNESKCGWHNFAIIPWKITPWKKRITRIMKKKERRWFNGEKEERGQKRRQRQQ